MTIAHFFLNCALHDYCAFLSQMRNSATYCTLQSQLRFPCRLRISASNVHFCLNGTFSVKCAFLPIYCIFFSTAHPLSFVHLFLNCAFLPLMLISASIAHSLSVAHFCLKMLISVSAAHYVFIILFCLKCAFLPVLFFYAVCILYLLRVQSL